MKTWLRIFIYVAAWTYPLLGSICAAQNITLDNTDPKLLYFGPWATGPNCTNCSLQPDPKKVYNGTWQDSTYDATQIKRPGQPGFTFLFEGKTTDSGLELSFLTNVFYVLRLGTAVYIYCALSKYLQYDTVATQLNFYIDGKNLTSKAFYWSPSTTTTNFRYNVSVFAIQGLSSGSHNLTVRSWAAFLFDRLVFTCVSSTCSSEICHLRMTMMMLYSPVEHSSVHPPMSSSPFVKPVSLSSVLPSSISSSHETASPSPASPLPSPTMASPSPSSIHVHGSRALAISLGTIIGGGAALVLTSLAVVRWRRQRKACNPTSPLQQLFVDTMEIQSSLHSSASIASLPVPQSNLAARPYTPGCTSIQVQASTLDTVGTLQEHTQEIARLASAIGSISSTPHNERSQGADEEMAALRARMAQLEMLLSEAARAWQSINTSIRSVNVVDGPPPEYQPSPESTSHEL